MPEDNPPALWKSSWKIKFLLDSGIHYLAQIVQIFSWLIHAPILWWKIQYQCGIHSTKTKLSCQVYEKNQFIEYVDTFTKSFSTKNCMYAFRHVDFYFLNILLSIPRFIWQVNIKLVFDLNNAQKNLDLIYGMNIFYNYI